MSLESGLTKATANRTNLVILIRELVKAGDRLSKRHVEVLARLFHCRHVDVWDAVRGARVLDHDIGPRELCARLDAENKRRMAATYANRCVPRGVAVAAHPVPLAGEVADVVWLGTMRVTVDELLPDLPFPDDVEFTQHIDRLRLGAIERWGAKFAGVRVLLLTDLDQSYLVTPSGAIEAPIRTHGLEVQL